MILSTHAIVGASIESLIPNHPMLAFASGMASHFVNICDSPWDYPLRSISLKLGVHPAMIPDFSSFRDLGLITLDACVG
jgi:hypothetical protein